MTLFDRRKYFKQNNMLPNISALPSNAAVDCNSIEMVTVSNDITKMTVINCVVVPLLSVSFAVAVAKSQDIEIWYVLPFILLMEFILLTTVTSCLSNKNEQ
jgi:hypothetical protein